MAEKSPFLKALGLAFRTAGCIALVFLLMLFRIVGFAYPVPDETSPLHHSVRVQAIEGSTLITAHGQRLQTHRSPEELVHFMEHSQHEIEIVPSELPRGGIIKYKRRWWRCGFSDPLITIPIVPFRYPVYRTFEISYQYER